ncbi:MAG: dihydrofolate reductase [Firmicutes bacterium]|nr:dihydrofolate reductase [Bacillota bacterium]
MFSFIIAVGENNEMGVNNHLPWHLPKEIGYFRSVTEWHTIIMGRKTFESLPKVLPNRRHIVLTKDKTYKYDHPNVEIVNSLEEVFDKVNLEEENIIIGGAEIFHLFLPYTDRIYLTIVHKTFKADIYFFDLDMDKWIETKKWEAILDDKTNIPHTYYVLDRNKG